MRILSHVRVSYLASPFGNNASARERRQGPTVLELGGKR